ncbi:uncharacterized protein LOC132701942 isoform X2 [Cylas formicarius]|uniref:uncharacterized protein LOC132701942 isoform X2 n=1 Tax=Cylas formicarius TaxID=197179 RepID=UPI002958C027|nr:uncharacterized protein LOC132701942 isoform X2 [Cylas formicarius]
MLQVLRIAVFFSRYAKHRSVDNYDPMDKKPKIPINRRFPKKTLRTISLLYYKIVKVSNMLNQTFSFQIILMLYKSLITILESIDYCLSNATGITIWTDLFWSCATMLEVLIMFLLTTKLQSQTKETAKIVNMIEPNKNDMMQIEKIIFLLQAKQHKLDLTACKLFPLNANMFLKVSELIHLLTLHCCINIYFAALRYYLDIYCANSGPKQSPEELINFKNFLHITYNIVL